MNDSETLVKVENLSRYYDAHCAVQDVSFELRKGEILGFLGPNGAGKSTTMQILSGNLAPSAGQVLINGIDLLDEPKRAKASIGYLPEIPPLYPELSVDEYLDYCAHLHHIPRAQVRSARDSARQRCGLKDVGRRLIGNLSKGFQQRVGIAQAIIHSPAVVILDEPTIGLDPIQIREIRALITELGREHSVILSTHILPEVQTLCSRVQIINKGRLVFNDTLAGLSEHLQASSLLLTLRRAADIAVLERIPGVEAVEELEHNVLRIAFSPGNNPAEAVAAVAVQQDWGLLELTQEHKTLEQIFVALTTSDESAGNRIETAVREVAAQSGVQPRQDGAPRLAP
ncbi:MAG TPA: ATP-binding cassette domain-containing protein [Gammaproteobacteria bacterium]|nr:ATP-binding cassette domain-containing protein [Gammaproteobacteria bacterium]